MIWLGAEDAQNMYLHIAVSSTGPLGSVLALTLLQPHHIQTLLIPI